MRLPFLTLLVGLLCACLAAGPDSWVPARWSADLELSLLDGTPINCLVVPWEAGARDADFVRRARQRGLAVVGEARSGENATAGNLDAIVRTGPWSKLLAAGELPVLAVSDSLWPRVQARTGSAGPTGDPWLDSNPWRVRSLRASRPDRPVWLAHRPKDAKPEEHLRAVADAAMAGGHWVVDPAANLRANGALWRRLSAYLKFYQDHADWRRFSPRATLAVVQDPAGRNLALSGENLNLLARRQMPYRVINRADLSATALAGVDTVVAVDLDPPTDAERRLLEGRQVFFKQPVVADPFALSLTVLNRMGRANQGVRLFNASSVISYLSADAGGKRVLLQLVNYADGPIERVTARVTGEFRAARLYQPEEAPLDLAIEASGSAAEFVIPKLSIAAAVLLE